MSAKRKKPTAAGKTPATKRASTKRPTDKQANGDTATSVPGPEESKRPTKKLLIKQPVNKEASDRQASGNKVARFNGMREYSRLIQYPPTSAMLSDAREHILHLIHHSLEDDKPGSREEKAERKAVKEAHFLFSIEQSVQYLPNYATLDHAHISEIINFTESVEAYIQDATRSQPLNWMMLASPGEGKSHFIKCIAGKLEKEVEAVFFNMASMRQADDLRSALDKARNETVRGKLPLLFLDEFDSDPKNYSLLLPLLWDGVIELGTPPLTLGRAVIVLAGSDPTLPDFLKQAAGMSEERLPTDEHNHKLVDLLSRINGGVITIPSLREVDPENQRDRRVDKVCVAIVLLRQKYLKKGLKAVPASLLSFIYHTTFKYGVRSIQHLIEVLGSTKHDGERKNIVNNEGVLNIAGIKSIFEHDKRIKKSSLAHHLLHIEREAGIKEDWDQSLKYDDNVPVWCEAFRDLGRPASWKEIAVGSFAWQMVQELRGNITGGEFLDVTTFAGIEPLHVTQLWLSPNDGEWNHGNHDMRHVFFNLSTLQELLSEVIAHSKPPMEVGRRMGKRFGHDFVGFLPKIGERVDKMEEVINHWCHFDVSGGWGMWEPIKGDNENTGELWVRNNFLAELDKPIPGVISKKNRSRFCTIMEGYIQGVLEEITKEVKGVRECSVKVEELRGECGVSDPKSKPCKFKYTIKY